MSLHISPRSCAILRKKRGAGSDFLRKSQKKILFCYKSSCAPVRCERAPVPHLAAARSGAFAIKGWGTTDEHG
jgi:hypothetical protein